MLNRATEQSEILLYRPETNAGSGQIWVLVPASHDEHDLRKSLNLSVPSLSHDATPVSPAKKTEGVSAGTQRGAHTSFPHVHCTALSARLGASCQPSRADPDQCRLLSPLEAGFGGSWVTRSVHFSRGLHRLGDSSHRHQQAALLVPLSSTSLLFLGSKLPGSPALGLRGSLRPRFIHLRAL